MEIIRRVDNNVEFYTVIATGKSGMSQSGLAILSGVKHQSINKLENTLAAKAPSNPLKSFVGKCLTLAPEGCVIDGKPVGKLKIYSSEFCNAVIQHYAFKGNETAQYSLGKFSGDGLERWIQGITGWTKPNQPSQASMVGYWAERQRLFIQRTTIPSGWFCIFEELAKLMWQLENLGYIIPDYSPVDNSRIVPDISIGRMFSKHMRNKGFAVGATVRKYPHWYPGWKLPVKANVCPNAWLEEFRAWFDDQWKPNRLVKYLGKKDPSSLPSISKLLGLPETPVQLKLLELKDGAILVPEDYDI